MKKIVPCVLLLATLVSCKKERMMIMEEPFSEAAYSVTFTGKWAAPAFGVPAGVHFTALAGAVHTGDAVLWKANEPASRSLQYVAENGYAAPLLADVDTLIGKRKALAAINIAAPPPAGPRSFNLYANSNCAYLSFATMLAPTPDWFTGVAALALYDKGRWVQDTTLQLYAYDAGTKDGDAFSYYLPATAPQQRITQLTTLTASVLAAGNASLAPIAELRLVKK